jgi:hypothetical protein
VRVRWALAGLLSAGALAACGSDEATQEQPQPAEPGTTTTEAGLPEGWTLCSNERAGYAIGYPADWNTATLEGEFECSFFDPEPFEIIEGSEFPLTALQAFPAGEERRSYDRVVEEFADPMFERELGREEATVAGFPTVRLETEATGQGLFDKGTKTLAYIVDRDVAPFVVRAQAFPGGELHESVLVQAVTTIRFFQPVGEASPGTAVPPAVEETRDAILAAAEQRDFDALAELIPEEGFTYTFGGDVEGGPTAYWQKIEEESPERPLETLAAILRMPHTKVEDIYVWPFAYNRDIASLTDEEREILAPVADAEAIGGWTQYGGYLGWRAGIKADGTWVFFVAGD